MFILSGLVLLNSVILKPCLFSIHFRTLAVLELGLLGFFLGQDKKVGIWVGRKVGYLAMAFALKEHYRPIYLIMRKDKEMFYLTTLSTHFIYGYMASDIW